MCNHLIRVFWVKNIAQFPKLYNHHHSLFKCFCLISNRFLLSPQLICHCPLSKCSHVSRCHLVCTYSLVPKVLCWSNDIPVHFAHNWWWVYFARSKSEFQLFLLKIIYWSCHVLECFLFNTGSYSESTNSDHTRCHSDNLKWIILLTLTTFQNHLYGCSSGSCIRKDS